MKCYIGVLVCIAEPLEVLPDGHEIYLIYI